ncbi:MAG: phosphate acetyltransferase [Verrucomicrobia bacterium]|nr:phosphate acetyltransferase [Verrucomicrobiota bacterium]MBU4290186.1 phosphate acetyltransferase [Verrucomicrobiota bacterium]MBU4430187.1 phosphate acetyltransferase [Verrucomicrobiota bacterium]MBU4497932.1 phosphate acetyltransferase [Verrucomicrobiota bacterium]MCG2681698.1 phosphate acetyltransferase [Kiritimatiellia bacterium]
MAETVLEKIRSKAKTLGRKICLTESDDIRNLQAAAMLVQTGYAKPVLIGDGKAIDKLARDNGVNLLGVEIADIQGSPRFNDYMVTVVGLRKSKGLTEDQARLWLRDTCVFAAAMVCAGDAHGYVSGGGNPKGYNHDTAGKTRPALQLFRTAPGIKVASAYFIMQLPDPKWGYNGALFYADCGLNINPNADQLAEIAVTTARTYAALTGDEPRVGMISCSTKGSAKDPIVDKVIQATAKAKALAPELLIDGEFQFDAAVIPAIGAKKAPGSRIAGRCNVLIFPDLNCGNTMYKATERLAGAAAIGPLIQGLRRPFNDVSRGCSVDDIVDCAAMAAITEWTD